MYKNLCISITYTQLLGLSVCSFLHVYIKNDKNKHLFKGIAFGIFKNLKNTFTILIMLKHLSRRDIYQNMEF